MSLYRETIALGYADTAMAVAACIVAKKTPMVMGAPGVGKTTQAAIIAQAFKKKLVTAILSNCDPTDIAGLPMLDAKTGKVGMHPFPVFAQAAAEPCILFVDEFTAIRRSVEAPALRLMLERVAGGAPLHPETRIIGACNAPEHAPGGIELSAAMLNRMIWLRYTPSFKDASTYFQAMADGVEPPNVSEAKERVAQVLKVNHAASLALEFADFSATAAVQPDLIQLDPPPDAIVKGMPWASPRAWEAGLAAYAALGRDATSGKADLVGYAILSGAVGPFTAAAYLGIRDLRTQLPSVTEILDDPKKAKLPTQDLMVASIGVISRVAAQDVGAAFMYISRLKPEIAAAAYRPASVYVGKISQSKHGAAAIQAYTQVSRDIGSKLR